jgi:cell division protein ZipA
MDFGLREWLLVIGSVFVIGILMHGYLRMRANRNSLKMSLDKSFMSDPGEDIDPEEDLSMLRAELPNGGARVRSDPEQAALDLEQDVPVLMEPVEMGEETRPDEPEPIRATREEEAPQVPEVSREAKETVVAEERPEHFVVLYVSAVNEPFDGQNLLETLVEADMQFGEMSIFHRVNGEGRAAFSLANAVEPGTFDIGHMDELSTPAVSLFMKTHELDRPTAVFDQMVEVAQTLADELGGEVKDETRSVLTPQTVQHCRDEIRDYEHRYH